MPKINVAKPFRLNMPDGTTKDFDVGEQSVDKEIADHWFVKAHLVGASFEPKEGSFEYAQRNRALKSEEDTVAAEQQAEADAQARADAEARAAALLQKTNETIAAVAQQAQDNLTRKDPQPANAVTDLPPIPLASGAPAGEGSQTAGEGGDQQQAAGEEQAPQQSQGEAGTNDGEKTAEQKAE